MQGSRIAVIGIGAIGGSIAADLADLKRHELSLCSRTPFDSLEVSHPGGTSITKGSMINDPKKAQPVSCSPPGSRRVRPLYASVALRPS